MRISEKGQVTIPLHIRERAGLLPHTEVEFVYDGQDVKIVRATNTARPTRGDAIVEALRGRGAIAMSTDEIMALTRGEIGE
jgi:AbrB family looped-hinge helix DNA binding protein